MAAITLSSSIELPARASEPAGEVQETADSEKTVLAEELDEEEEKGSTEQPAPDKETEETQEISVEEENNLETSDILIEETEIKETEIKETEIEETVSETSSSEVSTEEPVSSEQPVSTEEPVSSEQPVSTEEPISSEQPVSTEENSSEETAPEETTSTEELTQEIASTEELTQEFTTTGELTEETEEEEIASYAFNWDLGLGFIDDIASGSYKNVYWRIDRDGKLTVKGNGEYCEYPQHTYSPWYPYRESIKTAEVRLSLIENPSFMFEDCVNLTSVDISQLDTSLSTNLSAMFRGCSSLKSIDLSKLDTSKATQISAMFADCSSLETLDLSNFDTSNVTDMAHLFSYAKNLKHISFGKKFTTAKVTRSPYMFEGCYAIEELDLSSFAMPVNNEMKGMFEFCRNLKKLTFGEKFSAAKATDVSRMFWSCDALNALDLSAFDLRNVQYANMMLAMDNLLEFQTPRNVKINISMPNGIWQTSEGQCITDGYLPKNQNKSMKLTQQMQLIVTKTVTEYSYGSKLDLSDLKVEYRNSTGSIREQVKDYTTNAKSIDMNTAGTKDLIVTYKGISATVKITVKKQTVLDRFVLDDDAKTVYMPGEKPCLDGIWLHGYLGNDRKISTVDYRTNLDEIDTSTPGVKKLKVWYADACGEIDLFVMEPFQNDDIAHKRYDTLAYRIDKNGNLTMMGSHPRLKNHDWSGLQNALDCVKTAKIVIRGADDFSELLSGCRNLESVDFSGTETKYVKNFIQMFYNCSSLKSVDLSGFDTENATNMSSMFSECKSLKNVDLSGFQTKNVKDMSGMFGNCTALESVNLSSFDTGSVIRMRDMFSGCNSLSSLPIGSFKTGSVTNMSGMFAGCSNIKEINLSHFDTRNVENMSRMFVGCKGLTSLDLRPLNTQKVTDMSEMFDSCSNLTSLNLSNFDTRNVKNMSEMFNYCTSLKSLDVSRFNTQAVTNMGCMFSDCSSLTSLDVTRFDTRNVTNMRSMFRYCNSLSSLDVTKFDTRKLENASYMFQYCKKLTSLDVTKFDTGNVTSMREMFRGCYALEALDTSSFQTGKVKDMAFMFADCLSLTSLNVDSFDVRNAEDLSYMFYDSRELKKLNLSGFDMGGITSVYGAESLVEGCRELEELWTPRNIKVETSLYGTWYDDKDNAYTEFPRNTGTSIHLRKTKTPEEPDEESSSSEESSSTEESSSQEESSSSEESSTTEESSSIEESSSQEESSSSEESSTTEESSSTVESSTTEESSSVEESSETEESSDTEESSSQEESSSSEESSTTEESSKADESASSEESSDTEEHPSSEETSSSEESPTEEERSETDESESAEESPTLDESSSPYADEERIDLQKAGGKIAAIKSKTYDGLAYNPSVKVTVTEGGSRRTLTEGTDYSVLYEQNTDAGQGIAVVRGNGLYKGTLRTTFEITPKSIKRLKIMTGSMTAGSQSEPPVYVYDGTKRLEKGKDYKLTYAGDLTAKASKAAKVTVTAAGNYEGSSTVKLAVYENDASHIINPEHVALQTQSVPYTGKAQKPALTVAIDGMTLRANKDYKVQYQNNKNAGTACVVVTGKGAYKGKVVKTFEITALGKTNTSLTVSKISDKTYNGKYQKPSVTVKCGSKKLAKNKDYTVTYQHNLHASADNQKAKVIITGKGNYEGIVETAEFVIKPQKISKAAVKGTMEHFTLTYGGTKLKEGVHYTITSTAKAGSKKVKIKIEGLGDFAGSEMTKSVKAK